MNDTKRTYTKRSSRWYEKSGERRTLLYNQAALASPIGQKMLKIIKEEVSYAAVKDFWAEIAEIESAK